jgi:hypothetical protein
MRAGVALFNAIDGTIYSEVGDLPDLSEARLNKADSGYPKLQLPLPALIVGREMAIAGVNSQK